MENVTWVLIAIVIVAALFLGGDGGSGGGGGGDDDFLLDDYQPCNGDTDCKSKKCCGVVGYPSFVCAPDASACLGSLGSPCKCGSTDVSPCPDSDDVCLPELSCCETASGWKCVADETACLPGRGEPCGKDVGCRTGLTCCEDKDGSRGGDLFCLPPEECGGLGPGLSCNVDADCNGENIRCCHSREGGSGRGKECTPVDRCWKEEGWSCSGDGECYDALACCVSDQDPSLKCQAPGNCRAPIGTSCAQLPCVSTGSCCTDKICQLQCPDGSPCLEASDCTSGLCCADQRCASRCGENSACTLSSQCLDGLACCGGKCLAACVQGQSCDTACPTGEAGNLFCSASKVCETVKEVGRRCSDVAECRPLPSGDTACCASLDTDSRVCESSKRCGRSEGESCSPYGPFCKIFQHCDAGYICKSSLQTDTHVHTYAELRRGQKGYLLVLKKDPIDQRIAYESHTPYGHGQASPRLTVESSGGRWMAMENGQTIDFVDSTAPFPWKLSWNLVLIPIWTVFSYLPGTMRLEGGFAPEPFDRDISGLMHTVSGFVAVPQTQNEKPDFDSPGYLFFTYQLFYSSPGGIEVSARNHLPFTVHLGLVHGYPVTDPTVYTFASGEQRERIKWRSEGVTEETIRNTPWRFWLQRDREKKDTA